MRFKLIILCLAVMLLMACQKKQLKPENNPLLGAWQVVSVAWVSSEQTHTIEQAQPGMFIFNDSHYSLMWSPKRTPRTPFKNLSKPTDEEILAGFKSIVFNAGAYEVNGQEVVATARVAKVPGFEGGQLFYRFEFDGPLLLLTMYDETYPDGTQPDWSGKWQTRFTLERALP